MISSDGEKLEFQGTNSQRFIPIILAMSAFRMLRKGCQGYLCAIEVVKEKEPNAENIS